jgi:glycosyltransferase involved in cell wall biosynthesis
LLEQQWKELGLEQYVSLLGAWPQERVRSKMLEAMVFVLPSIVAKNGNKDGIPVVLMEAMASGTPVITTRVSGIPEIVKDGYSGFLTNPGDYEELASKIELLLADKHQREFFARNARAAIEMDFVASKECIRLYQLFKGTIMKSYV